MTMRAAILTKQGSPVAEAIESRPTYETGTSDPTSQADSPGSGLATIRVECSALNHMDLWVGMGIPGVDLSYPRISGCDVCGVVERVGDGVSEEWVGTRVILNAAVQQPERLRPTDPTNRDIAPDYRLIGEHDNGVHRERVVLPVDNLVAIGEDTDPVDAAAFGLTFLTAYSMMITKGGLRPGQRVLITGIGGGVATAALSIAKWMACPVAVTSRHTWKLERAKELGADLGILDEGQDWSKDIRSWTGKRGVEMAVDSIGKPTHMKCIKSLARGGAFVTPGNTGGPRVETDQARLFWNQLRLLGSTMGTTSELKELASLFKAGFISPVVDSVFAWTDAQSAWARLEAQQQFGKVVIDWRDEAE